MTVVSLYCISLSQLIWKGDENIVSLKLDEKVSRIRCNLISTFDICQRLRYKARGCLLTIPNVFIYFVSPMEGVLSNGPFKCLRATEWKGFHCNLVISRRRPKFYAYNKQKLLLPLGVLVFAPLFISSDARSPWLLQHCWGATHPNSICPFCLSGHLLIFCRLRQKGMHPNQLMNWRCHCIFAHVSFRPRTHPSQHKSNSNCIVWPHLQSARYQFCYRPVKINCQQLPDIDISICADQWLPNLVQNVAI